MLAPHRGALFSYSAQTCYLSHYQIGTLQCEQVFMFFASEICFNRSSSTEVPYMAILSSKHVLQSVRRQSRYKAFYMVHPSIAVDLPIDSHVGNVIDLTKGEVAKF